MLGERYRQQPNTYREGKKYSGKTLRGKIQMSSTETMQKGEELYNDTDSKGG